MDPQAPPVVAVVVTCDAGYWLEEALSSLAGQDYPALSMLVLDAASAVDPTIRVAAVAPDAYVHRLPTNAGFAASANHVLSLVQGATHLVFCHDDVALAPDAVRQLVEEAFRSNAGVVAPKLVDWARPEHLLAVGMDADKGGVPAPRVEQGELDHEQHDSVRDVFAAPGGATLVRADLFATLGGFDAEMFLLGEDLDLSWRAQVVGARVVVAPAARARHLEALSNGLRSLPRSQSRSPGAAHGRRPSSGRASLAPGGGGGRSSPGAGLDMTAWQRRHELRSVLKSYRWSHLLRVVPQLAVLAVGEMAWAVLTGQGSRAQAIAGAWRWNLARLGDLRTRRRALGAQRRVPDKEVRRLQVRGSARLSALAGSLLSPGPTAGLAGRGPGLGAARLGAASEAVAGGVDASGAGGGASLDDRDSGEGLDGSDLGVGRSALATQRAGARGRHTSVAAAARSSRRSALGGPATTLGVWVVAALVLLYGTRNLLGGPLPAVSELVPMPGWGTFLHLFLSGWRSTGLGSNAPAPLAFALLGVGGAVLAGSMGLLAKLLVLGAIPAGAIGAYRLARPLTSVPGRLVSMVVYLILPLPYNALSQGHWGALAAYAAAPWALGRLVRVTELPPLPALLRRRPPPVGRAARRRRQEPAAWPRQAVGLGVLVAVVGSLVPAWALLVVAMGLGLVLGSVLVGQYRSAAGALGVAAAGAVVGAVLSLPWTLDLIGPGAHLSVFTGQSPAPSAALGLGALLRFQTATLGGGPVGWAFVVAAALPLLVGQQWRLAWATRLWGVAVVSWGLAWLIGRGWLGLDGPPPDVALAPAGAALAAAAGLGLMAFQMDLPGYRLGWRQGASVVAAAALVVATVSVLALAVGGRWGLPSQGYDSSALPISPPSPATSYRVLWLGSPQVIPLRGWVLAPGLAYGTSLNGPPSAVDLWPSSDPGAAQTLSEAVDQARYGRTSQLGHLLAPAHIRYVAVTLAGSPGGNGPLANSPSRDLVAALAAQDDLRPLPTSPGLALYQNSAFIPGPSVPSHSASGLRALVLVVEALLWAAAAASLAAWRRSRGSSSGVGPQAGVGPPPEPALSTTGRSH